VFKTRHVIISRKTWCGTQSSKQALNTPILVLEKKGQIKRKWYEASGFYSMEKSGRCGQCWTVFLGDYKLSVVPRKTEVLAQVSIPNGSTCRSWLGFVSVLQTTKTQSRDLDEQIHGPVLIRGPVLRRFGFHLWCIPGMTVKEVDQLLLSYL